MMFGKKKKGAIELHMDKDNNPGHEITILVTEEDKTGSDIKKMSDFFSVALDEMSRELADSDNLVYAYDFPATDLNTINDALQMAGIFRTPEYDLVLDFSSLPKEVLEKYKAGKLKLGESRQVKGNLRAVLIDVESKGTPRVKDVTLKKVERLDNASDISRDMMNQIQLKQMSEKLDFLIEEQSYMIDFSRDQAMMRPFLDARDNVLMAQESPFLQEQEGYLKKATESLRKAINAVYVDMHTIEGSLALEARKKWFQRINRRSFDKQINRLTSDAILVTKYVGMQMQVYHYLNDISGVKLTLDAYKNNIGKFFQEGIVAPDKTLALFIHENVEYGENNMDCWFNMEEQFKPILEAIDCNSLKKDVYVLTEEDSDE